ncbi:unnamed protein product [Gadus morhua 'NCC']
MDDRQATGPAGVEPEERGIVLQEGETEKSRGPGPNNAPTVTDVNRLFCVGLRGLNNPDIVATDLDPRHRDPRKASTERVWSWELQVDGGQEPFSPTGTDGRGDGGARHEVRGGRLEVLAVRSVASSGGARREVRGGRLEALAAGGGKAGSRAAQGMQNEGLRRRSWRQRPAWRRRWPGGPGGVQPGRGGMEGQVAAPHPGLEAANLEGPEMAEVLEAEANLEVLESVGLEAAAAAILEVDYLEVLEADCGDRPGGGVHMAAVGLEVVANLEKPGGNGGPGGPRGGHPGEPRGAGGSHPGGAGGSHPGGDGGPRGSQPGGPGGGG